MPWLEENRRRRINLPQIIAERAEKTPDDVLAMIVDGPIITYGQFHARIMEWAAALHRQGVRAGDHVVTFFDPHFDAYAIWIALAWLGAVDVPFNPAYRGNVLRHGLLMSDAKLAILGPTYVERVAEVYEAGSMFNTALVLGNDPLDAGETKFNIVREGQFFAALEPIDRSKFIEPGLHHIACIIFTSGTTGPAKAVLVPWGQMIHASFLGRPDAENDERYNQNDSSVFYAYMPIFHMSGRYGLAISIFRGSKVAYRPIFSVDSFWNDVRRYGCTHAQVLTPMMAFLLSKPPSADDRNHTLYGVNGGPISPIIQQFIDRFGVRVRSGFGMTECGGPLGTPWMSTAPENCGDVVVGPPEYELLIADENDYPVRPGEVGELLLRTREPWATNAGYYKMPEETARAWRNGWFHTGDAFRMDENGKYHFVDRKKDCIRRRGENISSFEVEGYVSQHPGVRGVAAVAHPSDYGAGEDEVKVFVVRDKSQLGSEQELWAFLKPRMPRYMLPRYIEFVEQFPLTEATNRIQKVKLKAMGDSPATWDALKQPVAA